MTKKSVKERNPTSKKFVREFSEGHPEVLAAYKKEAEKAVKLGKYRPSDSGIYEKERVVAHTINLFMIEEVQEMTMNNNTVHGDNFGAVGGSGNRVTMRDVNVYKSGVDAAPFDDDTKSRLKQAADMIEAATLAADAKEDAHENLVKLTDELKKEKKPGVVQRCLNRLAETLPPLATILGSSVTIAEIIRQLAT